ncbi:SDR family NAD(P)-dependent oxidoreductase [Clostridium sp. LP20]|uniref:type I polyketide synthase n=1 Tax=Clostridium sp. LP20 TaxID=3418665 RepID=UPI003EE60252
MEFTTMYIYEQVAQKKLSQENAKKMLKELKKVKKVQNDDVAIIGMACKLPGADNINEFWSNIENSINCIDTVPIGRREDQKSLQKDSVMKFLTGKTIQEEAEGDDIFIRGGFLKEIDKFDADFFNIPPKEATFMDPYQRLFLETAWESIEDAGYNNKTIHGTRTGVFVGRDYSPTSLYKFITEEDQMHLTGSWTGILASRISYLFNLNGPSMVVDTACSSGLVSVHLACKSMKNNECEMAIAGGINLSYQLLKALSETMDMSMVEAEDSLVKTFDKDAKGTVWGEGVCSLLLKPLNKAISDGDNIHAVIKGSSINNDGTSNGITAPNGEAQEDVILRTWKDANINPETIAYTEAHGTGTVLGDPIEVKALKNSFEKFTNKKQFCAIGTTKTNIGHTVAASGVAGLIKVVLSMKNEKIPAILNFNEPNPYISFCDSPVYVSDKTKYWEKKDYPRRAGISSFGFSGTNCYMVIEEAPEKIVHDDISGKNYIITISAKKKEILKEFLEKYLRFLDDAKGSIADICYTANVGRGDYNYRMAFIVNGIDDFRTKLQKVLHGNLKTLKEDGIYYGYHKIIANNKNAVDGCEITESEISKESKLFNKRIERDIQDKDFLESVCESYVKGLNIDWELFYIGKSLKKVSVPVYPLERKRFWANPKVMDDTKNNYYKEIDHPLLDRVLSDSMDSTVYVTNYSVKRQWMLDEHKLENNSVAPGVSYIELIREACTQYLGTDKFEIVDMMLLAPLVVLKDEIKEVQTVINRSGEKISFKVISRNGDNTGIKSQWIIHAKGEIIKVPSFETSYYDINELFEKCNDIIEGSESIFSDETISGPFRFGPRYNNIIKIRTNQEKNNVLTHLKLPEKFDEDYEKYNVHPSLLDNAINIQVSMNDLGSIFLPFIFKKIKIYGKMPKEFYSYSIMVNSSNETMTYNIYLIDKDGKIFMELENYSTKVLNDKERLLIKNSSKDSYSLYKANWINEEVSKISLEEITQKISESSILIFNNKSLITKNIINELKDQCMELIEVEFGNEFRKIDDLRFVIGNKDEDYLALAKEIEKREIKRIIYTDNGLDSFKDIDLFRESQERGLISLFMLNKVLFKKKMTNSIDISIIGRNISEVTGKETYVNSENSTMLGLGKVINEENTNLKCRVIDIDELIDVKKILNSIYSENEPYYVAYRGEKRYVEEYSSVVIREDNYEKIKIQENSTYIITGGLGSLGLVFARYLSSKAKVNISLINRSEFIDRKNWDKILQEGKDIKNINKIKQIRDIERNGSKVSCYSADISDQRSMKKVLEKIRSIYGEINGVIHAAGVASDSLLVLKDTEEFRNVLSGKVEGAFVLDKLTENDNLEFFINFSSVVTILGMQGQGDYTAANSFLNSFSSYQRKNGKNSITIIWPAWKEVGMAVDYELSKEGTLFEMIKTEEALEAFEEILDNMLTNIIPAKFNYSYLSQVDSTVRPFKLSKELEVEINKKSKSMNAFVTNKNKKSIEEISVIGKPEELLSNIEKSLIVIWAYVLGVDEIDIFESFNNMGGNSILAIQMMKELEVEYPGVIDISDIFVYSTIIDMANYINENISENISEYEEETKESYEDELLGLLDSLETGDTSLDEALEVIKDRRE